MFGQNNLLQLPDRPAAVKTGLSDGPDDAWTIGYTPQLVTGVWVGNSDNAPMPGALSSYTAAPIWHDFMITALGGQPVQPFPIPDGVNLVQVCASTGQLPTRGCSRVVNEVFLQGQEPPTSDALVARQPAPPPPPKKSPSPPKKQR